MLLCVGRELLTCAKSHLLRGIELGLVFFSFLSSLFLEFFFFWSFKKITYFSKYIMSSLTTESTHGVY